MIQIGEYVGTTMFLFMGFSTAQIPTSFKMATPDSPVTFLFIAFAFGISLLINVWIFFRVSGALFNPVISLSLALAKVISPVRAFFLTISQLLGGVTAAALVSAFTPEPLNVGNRLGQGVSIGQGIL